MHVCADAELIEFADADAAVAAALALATRHARVGIGTDEASATRAAARALPGMVVCPRDTQAFAAFDCFPLTATTALVRHK